MTSDHLGNEKISFYFGTAVPHKFLVINSCVATDGTNLTQMTGESGRDPGERLPIFQHQQTLAMS